MFCNIFVKTETLFSGYFDESSEQHFFEMEKICNIIRVFTFTLLINLT